MTARALLSVFGLALAALGAFAFDGWLDTRAAERRGSDLRLAELLTAEQAEEMSIAAVRVRVGKQDEHFYARTDGVWRCLSWRGALANGVGLSALVDALFEAAGTVDPLPAEHLNDWGFESEDSLLLTLHGSGARLDDAQRDVQFRVEIGHALPELNGCFARIPGQSGVLALDVDLRSLLSHTDGLPPLLDRTLLGASTLPPGTRFTDMLIGKPGVPPVRLTETPSGASEEDLRRGASPFVHVLIDEQGAQEYTVGPLVASFQIFLETARWEDQLDPRRAAEFGIGSGSARVALKRNDGVSFGLLFGTPRDDGQLPVFNTASGQLALVGPEVAAALQPSRIDFLPGALINLWDAWL